MRRFLELQAAMALGALACLLLGPVFGGWAGEDYRPGTPAYFAGDVVFLAGPPLAWIGARETLRAALALGAAMVVPVFVVLGVATWAGSDAFRWFVTGMYPVMSAGMLAFSALRSTRWTGSRIPSSASRTTSPHAEM